MELPPTVFETVASAIPPLRHHAGHYSRRDRFCQCTPRVNRSGHAARLADVGQVAEGDGGLVIFGVHRLRQLPGIVSAQDVHQPRADIPLAALFIVDHYASPSASSAPMI